MADPDLKEDGCSYIALGMDSFTLPDQLSDNECVCSMNTTCKGGLYKTRPGTATIMEAPQGPYFQGCTFFRPASGIEQLIFAVGGKVYVSNFPFKTYAQMVGVQFSVASPMIAWATCLQSTDYDPSGNMVTLTNPYSVLMMQDGATRAAVWDGSTGRHLNPTKSGMPNGLTQLGYDETPQGLWMCWSNNRLWLSQGNKVFASDQGNPTKFSDAQYIAEARAFFLPDVCTGMVESADHSGVWAFTETTGTYFQSSVQDRTLWLNTLNFAQTVLKTVGCVAPRSIVTQGGMLWWYSAKGLISMDDAVRMNTTSKLDVEDNEMYATKHNMSANLSGIAGCSFETFLLESVPNGDRYNTHTMCLDQVPFEKGQQAWCSYWTGWRPVEWCKGVIDGRERIFFASVDFDGRNRIWEANLSDKTDNGGPITCFIQTKEHQFQSRDWKTFKYAKLQLMEIYGHTSIMVAVAGTRGAYQPILRKDISADIGQVYPGSLYGAAGPLIAGCRPQTRSIRTQDMPGIAPVNEAMVESDDKSLSDTAFSLLIVWSGAMGLRSYRMFAYIDPQGYDGTCEKDEVAPRLLSESGAGSTTIFSQTSPFSLFTSDFTYTQKDPVTGKPVSHAAHATSIISQQDADIKANIAATNHVLSALGLL